MARARNRNYRKNVRSRLLPGWLAVLLAVAATAALGSLWLDDRCERLGRRIKDLEQQQVALHRRLSNEQFKWSNMTTFENMVKLLKQHNLEMDWPKERSVVRLRKPDVVAMQDRERGAYARN
jgi:hypothetical protein